MICVSYLYNFRGSLVVKYLVSSSIVPLHLSTFSEKLLCIVTASLGLVKGISVV